MRKTYLRDFERQKIAYLPVGALEWHGNHLPIETDSLVAEKLCEIVSEKRPGYILPSLFLGTDKYEENLKGMERHIGKNLPAEIYFIKPELLFETLSALIKNLFNFEKIYIVTGHAGSKQIETLENVEKEFPNVVFINPYSDIKIAVNHADEYETSLFWACYPNEEAKSREIAIQEDDDYFKWLGYDPRTKASLDLGNELLGTIMDTINRKVSQ